MVFLFQVLGWMIRKPSYFVVQVVSSFIKLYIEYGLQQFYSLKDRADAEKLIQATPSHSNYSYMDDELFQEQYVVSKGDSLKQVSLFLDGVHCAACVWIIEKLPQICPGVLESRLNFGKSVVQITYDSEVSALSSISATLDSIGYTPSALSEETLSKANQASERKFLIRMGVAALCAANTMLIAVSLYQGMFTGIPILYSSFLHWVSLFLTVPAVFYSAQPFYRAAIGGLRAGTLHIDLPISIGIIGGFLASVYNTVMKNEHVYFDSVCMLIFLLLIGRWFQIRGVRKAAESTQLMPSFLPKVALKLEGNASKEVYINSIHTDDLIEVHAGELIPIDGENC